MALRYVWKWPGAAPMVRTMTRAIFLAFLVTASCGSWPDTSDVPLARQDQPWPVLQPLDPILDPPGPASTGEAEAQALSARAAALRSRAELLRRPVAGDDEMEALRSRLGS